VQSVTANEFKIQSQSSKSKLPKLNVYGTQATSMCSTMLTEAEKSWAHSPSDSKAARLQSGHHARRRLPAGQWFIKPSSGSGRLLQLRFKVKPADGSKANDKLKDWIKRYARRSMPTCRKSGTNGFSTITWLAFGGRPASVPFFST